MTPAEIDAVEAQARRAVDLATAMGLKGDPAATATLMVVVELKKMLAFKAYVHQRLDQAGVPADPEPAENAKHGCRIEGRLNFVLAEPQRLRDAVEGFEKVARDAIADAMNQTVEEIEKAILESAPKDHPITQRILEGVAAVKTALDDLPLELPHTHDTLARIASGPVGGEEMSP